MGREENGQQARSMTGGVGLSGRGGLVRLDGLGGSARGGACWALAQLGWVDYFFALKPFSFSFQQNKHNY